MKKPCKGIIRPAPQGRWPSLRSGHCGLITSRYEKGPDGKPKIIPEQAETIRQIYQRYLAGDTLRDIKESLEAQGALTAVGTTEWTITTLRSILSNEKYTGDVLLQKTFVEDCISKKIVPNTGQLPKYLVKQHHEGIVSREIFDAVQMELARRRALSGATKKSAPSGLRKYSGKYALSGLLFCGECGTAYRRCVWTARGRKRVVWRCISRLNYAAKYCHNSPTLDEEPLKAAILSAINSAMSGEEALGEQLAAAMERELVSIPGESMSLADIDRAMESLGRQFDALLTEASSSGAEDYTERFQAISTAIAELKKRKAHILAVCQENEQAYRRVRAVSAALETVSAEIAEWDERTVYQILEKVTVLSADRVKVTFRSGLEIEQSIDVEKRRCEKHPA